MRTKGLLTNSEFLHITQIKREFLTILSTNTKWGKRLHKILQFVEEKEQINGAHHWSKN